MTSLASVISYTSEHIDIDFELDYAGSQSCAMRGEALYPIWDPDHPSFAGSRGAATLRMKNITATDLVLSGEVTKDRYI